MHERTHARTLAGMVSARMVEPAVREHLLQHEHERCERRVVDHELVHELYLQQPQARDE